jgi:nitroreductase
VRDKEKQTQLAVLKSEDNQQHVLTAPITIIVCVDTDKSPSRYIEDGVTATQNILLAVHDLGLGSVYITGCNLSKPSIADEVRDILSIPKNIIPITILPIGYIDPSEESHEKDLIKLNDIVHFNKW